MRQLSRRASPVVRAGLAWGRAGLALVLLLGAISPAGAALLPPLHIGAISYAGETTNKTISLLGDYLSRRIGKPVTVTMYPKYEQILAALEMQQVDVALLPPIVFLMAQEKAGVRPLANPVYQSGETNYRAVILASKSSGIAQLQDLKGKKMAFVDKLSASGYIVPRGMLNQAGLQGARDVKEVFSGNHMKAVESLIKGETDAAATYDMLLVENPSLGKTLEDFTVLARSEPIPGEVLAVTREFPGGQAVILKAHLTAFAKQRETDKSLEGCLYQWFFNYDPVRYDGLRKLWKASQQGAGRQP